MVNVLQLFLCILHKIGSFKTQLTCVFALQLKEHNFVFCMLIREKNTKVLIHFIGNINIIMYDEKKIIYLVGFAHFAHVLL